MGAREDLVVERFLGACLDMRRDYTEKGYISALEEWRNLSHESKYVLRGTFYRSIPETALTVCKVGEIDSPDKAS